MAKESWGGRELTTLWDLGCRWHQIHLLIYNITSRKDASQNCMSWFTTTNSLLTNKLRIMHTRQLYTIIFSEYVSSV